MTNDPVEEAIQLLLQRRGEAAAEIERIDAALASLGRDRPPNTSPTLLNGGRAPAAPIPFTQHRRSVRTMLIDLLTEASGRDWNVAEILEEYKKRGTPVHGKDPENALRAAVNEAYKGGQIIRTAIGRYRIAPTVQAPMPTFVVRQPGTGVNEG